MSPWPVSADPIDELAVRRLPALFADAVNRRAPEDLEPLFTEDSRWTVPGAPTAEGAKAVVAGMEQLLVGFPFVVQVLHQGVVSVDGGAATGRWYLEELVRDGNDVGWRFVGVYQDAYRRTSDGWRFAERAFSTLYAAKVDMSGRTFPFPELIS